MLLQTLALATVAIAAPLPGNDPPITAPRSVEIGLTAPLERLTDLESFSHTLAERLTWTVATGGENERAGAIQFTAVRIDRGRVTASYQSEPADAARGTSRMAESIGTKSFMAFPDVCLTPDDPPAGVRAVAGTTSLDPEQLERAVAQLARSGRLDEAFRLTGSIDIEWGRHVVLVLAATSADPELLVRPLILVLERV